MELGSERGDNRNRDVPEEVPDDGLDNVPADKDVDEFVANVAQTDGSSELVDETNGADNDARGGQALGAHGGLERLAGDDALQGGVGEGEDDVEEEVGGQGTLRVRGDDIVSLVGQSGREARVDGKAQCARCARKMRVSVWRQPAGMKAQGWENPLKVPKTRTLRRGMRSVSATAVMAPMAERNWLRRLYPSCWGTEEIPRLAKMTVLKYPRPN